MSALLRSAYGLCAGLLLTGADASAQTRAAATQAAEPPRQARVLILVIDDQTRLWAQRIVGGIHDVLLSVPNPPALYIEGFDVSRFTSPTYAADFRGWLARKYSDRPLDLIIAIGEDAVGFLAEARGQPWPDTPVLFIETGVRYDLARDLPKAAGIILESHFRSALGVVKRVLPDTQRVVLIYGASDVEHRRFSGFADEVRAAGLGLEPMSLPTRSMDDVLAQVARLPEHTVVFILAPYVDAQGRSLPQARACELIATAANRPSFSLPAHDLGCGVVGGLLRDFTIVGRAAGTQALRALATGKAQPSLLRIADYTTLAFDARQLSRWGIRESRLPAGSRVEYREPNVWRDYRWLVIAAITVAAVQALLIGALLFEHLRRRRAEVNSRQHLAAVAHLDRRAAMGELTTSLAHELNQPLNAILQNAGAAEMMLASQGRDVDVGEIREILADIRSDDVRAGETIRRMRALLRKQEIETQSLDLNDFTRDTIALVAADARAREVRVETDLGPRIAPVLGDRVHLQQVLLNLILNGMEAMAVVPRERRALLIKTVQNNGTVEVSVRDAGPGITTIDPARVFEPFYTTKQEGMGMGLSIARSIIEAHKGRISAENNAEGGATVRFHLPASRSGA